MSSTSETRRVGPRSLADHMDAKRRLHCGECAKVNQLERALRELVLMALSLPDDDMHTPFRAIAREGQRALDEGAQTWTEQAPACEDEKNSPGNPLESKRF